MLKSGLYVVTDPCYVLNEENNFDWDDLLNQTDFFQYESVIRGDGNITISNINGEKFEIAVFSTAFGDGLYYDQFGNEYGVDSGLIGVIPIEACKNSVDTSLSNIFEFKKDFSCYNDIPEASGVFDESCRGLLTFGHVVIDTNPNYEDDYGYDYEEKFD